MKRLLSSLFGRRSAGRHDLPEPRRDPCYGDPQARRFRALLERGSWREAADLFRAERRWADRALLSGLAADRPGRPAWLDAWVHERPDEPDGWLIRGNQSIHWAWEARTSGMAEEVTEEGWRLFFERIQLAFDDLGEAIERDGEDPTPWGLLVLCARAAQRDREEAEYYLEEATSRDRFHGPAHLQMLTFLCEKWFGSHQEMHEHARGTSAAAPPGSPLHDLVVEAVLEHSLYLQAFEQKAEEGQAYLESPAVRKRVAAAEAARFAPGAGEPSWQETRSHNLFAGYHAFVDDRESAARHVRLAGGIYVEHPWHYRGDADEVVREVHATLTGRSPDR